jgi:SAM-dependent methyltransferase
VTDFNVLLHELRTRELGRLPPGAATVLHGGSAGQWYFDWFQEHYTTTVRRHVGVDAFSGRPEVLADEVEWLQRSLGDLSPVGNGEVDLVFAGQVIEHLWPEEVVGFLLEARRVLRPAGILVMDSPNRRVTAALGWDHPQHTVEFRPDEIVELLELAGFREISVRGLWLCFDRDRQQFLSLEGAAADGDWTVERRAGAAGDRPEDSFVWWAEGLRGDWPADEQRIERRVNEIFADYRRGRFSRLQRGVGVESGIGVDRIVSVRPGEFGFLVFGPFVPMQHGSWVARFRVAVEADGGAAEGILGVADVAVGPDADAVALRELTPDVVPPDGRLREVAVPFELESPAFGVEFRVRTTGVVTLRALLHVTVDPVTSKHPE